jgi:hypothetical protein
METNPAFGTLSVLKIAPTDQGLFAESAVFKNSTQGDHRTKFG